MKRPKCEVASQLFLLLSHTRPHLSQSFLLLRMETLYPSQPESISVPVPVQCTVPLAFLSRTPDRLGECRYAKHMLHCSPPHHIPKRALGQQPGGQPGRGWKWVFCELGWVGAGVSEEGCEGVLNGTGGGGAQCSSPLERSFSTTQFRPLPDGGRTLSVEYFFSSDASAVVEHTKQVLLPSLKGAKEGGETMERDLR